VSALDRLAAADAPARLRARDTSLFTDDPGTAALVADRLGWTDLAEAAPGVMPHVRRLAEKTAAEGVTDIVLLGMGGSSLASLVMGAVLGTPQARLHVLDTVSPITVRATLAALDPARTVYVVASKSGGTIEPNTLYAIFRAHADEALGREAAGLRFVAVTDPGSSLEELAGREGFSACVLAEPTVGGRFSALTAFGLVPAALIGADVDALLERAAQMEAACSQPDPRDNPGARLAAFIADAHAAGRDKLTIVASPELATFGLWVEQLVAESLGKHGTGVVPVVELAQGVPSGYGPDRAVAVVRYAGDEALADFARDPGGVPAIDLVLDGAYDLGAQFVRWEHAIALTGHLLGINPFDEPNVAEAKAATEAVLSGTAAPLAPGARAGDVAITFAGGLSDPGHPDHSLTTACAHALEALHRGDYLAIVAYLPDDAALLAPLHHAAPLVAGAQGCAVCVELGPRYLHSTGQLHKGGPNTGVFVVVTTRDESDVEVPGQEWTLAELHRAQAEGDLLTLAAHDRRALRIDLPDASHASVTAVARALLGAAGVGLD